MIESVAAAFGIIATIPQCIEAAKQLYELRARYKDASVLITAIYSESMVVAASLSQIQSLLSRDHDILQEKPELYQTFDRALTGCRVVYTCLEEEVSGLAEKADRNDLGFRDKTKYLWKEDTFKELLQQIRGQQSGLSLLIQGLQMESITDIRKLVRENSDRLEQIARRSNTLRQKHPRVKVPETIYNEDANRQSLEDAQSMLTSAEFAFDDEVVNSAAYRRAMAMAIARAEGNEHRAVPMPEDPPSYMSVLRASDEQLSDPSPNLDMSAEVVANGFDTVTEAVANRKSPIDRKLPIEINKGKDIITEEYAFRRSLDADAEPVEAPAIEAALTASSVMPSVPPNSQEPSTEEHLDLLDTLERDMLPFMPPIPSPSPTPTPGSSFPQDVNRPQSHNSASESGSSHGLSFPVEKRFMYVSSAADFHNTQEAERPPPLPPRRPSPAPMSPRSYTLPDIGRTTNLDEQRPIASRPSMFWLSSVVPSHTPAASSSDNPVPNGNIRRRPLPLSHQASSDILNRVTSAPADLASPLPFEDAETHMMWISLIAEEEKFIDRVTKFRTIFYDSVIRQWPALAKHLETIIIGEQIAQIHREQLLEMMRRGISQGAHATCDPAIFEVWANQTQKSYQEYAQRMPHAESSLRLTQTLDPKFTPFVDTLGMSIIWFGKTLADYLRLPILQLDFYIEKLESLIALAQTLASTHANNYERRLKRALKTVQQLRKSCTRLLEESVKREEVQTLNRRLQALDSDAIAQLSLSEPERRVIFQGGLAIKVNGSGSWQPIHAVLLDNYLVWGKVKPPRSVKNQSRKSDDIWIFETPIQVSDIEVSIPEKSGQVQRATFMDDVPRGSTLYEIFVKSKTSSSKPHTLGAFDPRDRQEWYQQLNTVIYEQSS